MKSRSASVATACLAHCLSLGLAAGLLTACSRPPSPRGDIQDLYPQPPRPKLKMVQAGGRDVQVAVMPGAAGGAPLFFVHGAPGDWRAWARYLNAPALKGYGTRYAVDRPGYGGSGAGEVITDLHAQAEVLAGVIARLEPTRPVIVVGHSLGGPLVSWIALEHPEEVCGGVMVAGAVTPALEAPRWYNFIADTWLVRWMLPKEKRWANREILALQDELPELDAAWPRLQRPLVAIQGARDELVDPHTVDHLEQRAPKPMLRIMRVADQGHFVLWHQPEVVIEAIKSLACNGPVAPLPAR